MPPQRQDEGVARMIWPIPHNSLIANELQAGDLGFEPRLIDPESLVLPLHQSPRICSNRTSRPISYATDLSRPFQDSPQVGKTTDTGIPDAVNSRETPAVIVEKRNCSPKKTLLNMEKKEIGEE